MNTREKFSWAIVIAALAIYWQRGNIDVPTPPNPAPDEGSAKIVLVRETGDTTPDFARLVTALRGEAFSGFISSRGHKFLVLDDDAKDETGKPSVNQADIAGSTLPVLLVYSAETGKLRAKHSVPNTATVADIMQLLGDK